MKFFKDAELKEEVIGEFDLGIVKAGESKKFDFYIINDSLALLTDVEFIAKNKEIEFLNVPKILQTNEVQKFTIKWSPSIDLKKGLKVEFLIRCQEIWD